MAKSLVRRTASWFGACVAIAVFTAAMWVIEELAYVQMWYRGRSLFAFEAVNTNRVNALFADKAIPHRFTGGLDMFGSPVDDCDPLLDYWFGNYITTHYIVIGTLMIACVVMAIALWRLYARVAHFERLGLSAQSR